MKTKALSLILCLAMLMSVCVLVTGAATYPLPVLPKNVTHHATAKPVNGVSDFGLTRLSQGLTSSQESGLNLTEAQKADIADMSKYDVTMIGVKDLHAPLNLLVENNFGVGVTAATDDKTYNLQGESGKSDSIYQMIMTFNFGKLCDIDYMVFLAGSDQVPAAADIYVSNDGENWNGVGSYDLITYAMGGGAFAGWMSAGEFKDANGTTGGSLYCSAFSLGDSAQGKYLRICATAMRRTGTVNTTDYAANINTSNKSWQAREMFVLGTEIDEPNARPTDKLTYRTAKPVAAPNYGLTRLSQGLTSSELYTKDFWGACTSFTDAEKADIADMSKYGFTMHGVRALERPADTAVDNYFKEANNGAALSNGSKRYGAFAAWPDGNTYNLNGETGKNDSIYKMIFTLNLGKVSDMDYLVFLGGDNSMPNAADIFVSDDGVNWTAVGYYDIIKDRMEGLNITWLGGGDFTDATGNTGGGLNPNIIDLGDNVKGQYIRICATALRKSDSFNANNSYDSNVNNAGQIAFREMFVLGTEVDEVIKPVADTKLKSCEAWPTDYSTMTRISEGLTSFDGYTADYWGSGAFTAAEKAEMADMSKYGITAYGIKKAERTLATMTDGYFHNDLKTQTNGSYGFFVDDQTYNYKGETGKEDSIYQAIITLNFGKIYNLEYLTFLAGNNQVAAAADIYVSNDGVTWTAIGYYDVLEDLIEMKKTGSADNNVGVWGGSAYYLTDKYGHQSGNDPLGAGNLNHMWIDLGEGVQAQYLRICHTTAALPNTSNINVDNYGANLSNTTQICGREMIVYGTDADVDYRGVQLSAADENGNFDARFIASVDSLDYAKAGFEMKLTYFTANKTEGVSSEVTPYYVSTVYTSIKTYNGVYKDANGYYLMALTVEDIPTAVTKLVVEIRAFCENEAGEKCYDDWYEVTLEAVQTPAQVKK